MGIECRRGSWSDAVIAERKVDPALVRAVAATAVAAVPQVSRLYTREQLLQGDVPSDRFSRKVMENYHPQRSGDLEIVLHPFWIR